MLNFTPNLRKSGRVNDSSNIDLSQILQYEGDFLTENSMDYTPFKNASKNTVFISSQRDKPSGSGVIVNYKGHKYLVTATHVLGSKSVGTPTDLKVFERTGGEVVATNLEDLTMLYSTPSARERKLPVADVGVFEYKGSLEGVELQDPLTPESYVAVALGYPGAHSDNWISDLRPLVSPGKAIVQEKKKKELTPYMKKLLAEHGMSESSESVEKILFTGTTNGGNSGGGLFNLEGKLLGVCRGPQGSIGKETGLDEFYPVIQVLEALQK